jgi:hypothetical protein
MRQVWLCGDDDPHQLVNRVDLLRWLARWRDWAGELVFHLFGAVAHFERRLIAERAKDGIAAARCAPASHGR